MDEFQEQMKNAVYPESFPYYWPFYNPYEVFVRVSSVFPEVDDRYWVSNFGKVYDEKFNMLKKPIIQNNKYWSVSLECKREAYDDHRKHSELFTIHKLVCTAFNGPKPGPKYQVNHINSIRDDNWNENLEWLTPKENVRHSFIDGNRGVGENSNRNIFPEAVVRQICSLLEAGITDYTTICREVFHSEVTQQYKTLIYNIHSKKFWTSVSKDYNFEVNDPKKQVFTDNQIHQICQFLQANPQITSDKKGISRKICKMVGIDIDNLPMRDQRMYMDAVNNIRRKQSYNRITSQYNF